VQNTILNQILLVIFMTSSYFCPYDQNSEQAAKTNAKLKTFLFEKLSYIIGNRCVSIRLVRFLQQTDAQSLLMTPVTLYMKMKETPIFACLQWFV
jgi:hypothetical protein